MGRRLRSAEGRSGGRLLSLEIRPLRGHAEYEACLELQRATWGDAPGTLVPTPLLIVAQRLGGVAAGAFDEQGRLIGFVFGLTGVENGAVVHWSDMLAVRPEARDRGLGRRLKEYQREQVARVGARVIYWTYDPLVAKNAWLNIVVLGARVSEYVVEMYGETGSPVHSGLGTDRIIVAWDVLQEGSPRPAAPPPDEAAPAAHADPPPRRGAGTKQRGDAGSRDWHSPVVLNSGGRELLPVPGAAERVAIEIPVDIFAVRERSAEEARMWRRSSREAFQWALGHGYVVETVERSAGAAVARYILRRAPHREVG